MLQYIVKRILLFVPTLLLVSMLAFGLSRLAESDNTASLLALQGVESDMSGYKEMYARTYRKNGFDKPTFYFRLKPNYVKHDVNLIVDPIKRAFVTAHIAERYSTEYPKQILELLEEKKKANLISEHEVRGWIISRNIQAAVVALANSGDKDHRLSDLLKDAGKYKNDFHFPSFSWNGFDNQYHRWITQVLIGNFGQSSLDGQSSASKIWSALRWTLLLLVLNILVTVALSVPYGLYTGLHIGGRFDRWSGGLLFAIFSMPTFWIATLLVMLLTTAEYGMKIFPGVGLWYQSGDATFWQMIANKWTALLLPLLIIVVKDLAYLGRMIRDTVAGEAQKLYVTVANAKGNNSNRIAYKHVLHNALGPAITLAVGAIPGAFGGVLLMEIIFNIPGMGRLLFESIANADWQVVYPIVLLTAVVTVVWYLVGDVLYAYLNPKVSL